MKLTAIQVKTAAAKDKDYKLADGQGLVLFVKRSGAKYWRFNYRFAGKQKTFSIGVFPDVSLKAARDKRLALRGLLADGVDPAYEKKVAKIMSGVSDLHLFEAVAFEFVDSRKNANVWGDKTTQKAHGRLKNYVNPYIGKLPIASITAVQVLALVRKIEAKGIYETAHRVRSLISQIFRYGIATQRCTDDPAAAILGALVPATSVSFPAITDPREIGGLLRAIDGYKGMASTCFALKLAPLTLVRPVELRCAEKFEFDLDAALWTISAKKMKMNRDHLIPLSRQAVEVVSEAFNWSGKSSYLFPATTSNKRPMSENTVNSALRRMGYSDEEMVGHGFRAMGSTLLNEMGYDENWIEVQLAHKDSNKIRAAYNRAKYLPQRRQMLQEWADYLDDLRRSG